MTKGKGCRGTETPQWNMEERTKVKERNGRERARRKRAGGRRGRKRNTEDDEREMEEVESRREFV